jgi:hypothetical protein
LHSIRVDPARARAHRWKRILEDGTYGSTAGIAEAEKINRSFVSRLLDLTLLAPDIQEAIIDGRQVKGMQLEELTRAMSGEWGTNKCVYLVLIHTKVSGTVITVLGNGETLGVRAGNLVLLVRPRAAPRESSPAKLCLSERSSSHNDGRNL